MNKSLTREISSAARGGLFAINGILPDPDSILMRHSGGMNVYRELLNDPHNPYWGRYEGDEDTRRKPAYHNGTGWTLPFPLYAEALFRLYGEPARPIARAILASAEHLVNQDCVTQLPECVMGDAPHEPCGTGAQAWGVSELLRVLTLVEPQEEA